VLDTTAKAPGKRVKLADAAGPINSVVPAIVLRVVEPIVALSTEPPVIAGVVKAALVAKATTVPEPEVLYEVPQAVPVELAIPAEGYVALAPGTHAVPFQTMACPVVGVPVT
jgi:hypothetical protein